jgi:hypothetical protein
MHACGRDTGTEKHCDTQILGATSSQQLSENLKALDVVDRLTPELMERLDGLLETAPTPDDVTAMVQNYRTLYPVRD